MARRPINIMRLNILFISLFLMCHILKSYSQIKDISILSFTDHGSVTKNPKTNRYNILKNNKVIFSDLKYVGYLVQYLQVLDHKNRMFYVDINFKKQKEVKMSYGVCGTVPEYVYEIAETERSFVLMHYNSYENKRPGVVAIDSVSKEGISKIYFQEGIQHLRYDGNYGVNIFHEIFPHAMIFLKKGKMGIHFNDNTELYDSVQYINDAILIKKDGLYGYYHITKNTKYKRLFPFQYGLARFEMINGKKGYIDNQGGEYYD